MKKDNLNEVVHGVASVASTKSINDTQWTKYHTKGGHGFAAEDANATVYAYTESFKIDSTFYFTSKKMWVELFIKHFNELNESVQLAFDIIGDMVTSADEAEKPKKIGFCVPEQNENTNGNDVAAVAKK